MCCFSRPVQFVRATRIFARMSEPARQALAYQMEFGAESKLAMILPLPIPAGTGEDALKFINLKEYPDFFTDLRMGFPFPRANYARALDSKEQALKVETVGNFEASFVPSSKDFARLDPRFSLPEEIWDKIPAYSDYGFAVFKLRKGEQEVHPMAFTFPTRHPDKLFFPTVHIHDGEVHKKEHFDHQLYCQVNRPGIFAMTRWQESKRPASDFSQPAKSGGLIIGNKHLYRQTLAGDLANQDILLGTA